MLTLLSFNPWYVGGGVKSSSNSQLVFSLSSFNPWYVGGGVKRPAIGGDRRIALGVSILGMLEGVLKAASVDVKRAGRAVSILGMLEGVLKAIQHKEQIVIGKRFNPWYVGGGVKRWTQSDENPMGGSFNPWYVGGGVKSSRRKGSYNRGCGFQSLVCWRGC